MMLNDISFKLVSEDELITGKKTYSIFVVDVDPLAVKVMSVLLKDAGHKITSMMESKSAFETILTMKPDCVICGLMMPSVDGFQLCKMIAEQPELNNTKFIMVSENAYEFDHKHSFTFGAHGYIRKPLNTETFSVQVNRILNDHIDMRFGRWRGTLPVSSETALKYGGNTSCIFNEFPRQQLFVLHGGSEIKALGDWLAS